MPKIKNAKKSGYMYDSDSKNGNADKRASSVQPSMLPPFFREKTRLLQKIYVFLMVFSVSIATAVVSFLSLDNFSGKYGVTTNTQIAYMIITLIMLFITIGAATFYVWWSKTRAHLFTLTGTIGIILAPLVISAVLLYLDFTTADPNDPETIRKMFFMLGIASLAGGGVTGIIVILRNLIASRVYREAKFRSLFVLPGLLITSAAPFVTYITAKENLFMSFNATEFIFGVLVMFGGLVTMTIGWMFSMKYKQAEKKSTTSGVKLSGSLPIIVIATTLGAVGIKYMGSLQFELPLLITIAVDVVFLLTFMIFLFFKARIKNIGHANPTLNEFLLKSVIIAITIIGLMMVAIAPSLIVMKSYSELSFGILTVTSVSLILIVALGHFANLIVFEKFFKSIVGSTVMTILLILSIVFVLGTLSESTLIVKIISRSIVMVFLILAIVGEIGLLLLDVISVNKSLFTSHLIVRKRKKKQTDKKKGSQSNSFDEEEEFGAVEEAV